ncbi:hypothetical protein FD755_021563 [Muntiacus reevesi]|uniref:Triadin n=1 Tax=Muntiacus reevesi TaxID=9886 RepID=A0A5N3W2A4_MUNRE|nr:hypothetical protein FD755_021563 [Muntiacus reevesi]
MTSIEGNASTTTTVIDSKNGSVPKSPGKVLKRTVTEDIVTTFSSPAAWLLVIALIITWSAVAVVMFDLVDYKNLSVNNPPANLGDMVYADAFVSQAKPFHQPLNVLIHSSFLEGWIHPFFAKRFQIS